MTLLLLFILIAVGLGIVGVVVHGLLWLLAVGVIVLLLALVSSGFRLDRRLARRRTERAAR